MSSNKEITIYDIAKTLAISPSTVSRGLKDHPGVGKQTRKLIQETARKMGYQVNPFASNLRLKRTHTLGIIIPRLNSYFMSAVIAGMEKVANERGYMLVISQSLESAKKEAALVNTMFASRVDGLLVSLAYDTPNINHFDPMLKKDIPVIFFDRVVEHPGGTTVVIDNVKAGYDATIHLLDQGCKRIVYIGGNLKRNVYADRLKGYQQALMERSIRYDDELVIINSLSEEAATGAAKQITQMNPRPDGVFTANDTSAVACISEFRQAGINVPEEIAVVGFNNDPISRVIDPNLTTINYPGYEMGEIAATTLINTLDNPSIANLNTLVLRHSLIVRKSSVKNL